MFQKDSRCVGVALQCLVDVYLCLSISALLEEDPGIGVEIGGILTLCLDDAV